LVSKAILHAVLVMSIGISQAACGGRRDEPRVAVVTVAVAHEPNQCIVADVSVSCDRIPEHLHTTLHLPFDAPIDVSCIPSTRTDCDSLGVLENLYRNGYTDTLGVIHIKTQE